MTLIEEITKKGSPYNTRRAHDKLFVIPLESSELGGVMMDTVRFIEDFQLLDASAWRTFVEQYRHHPDDTDLGWRGEYWGKMMRGACFTYHCTHNEELYKTLEATVRDMLTTQDELGRITTYSVEKEFDEWDMWIRKYILLGMQYFYEICRDEELRNEIIDAICRHADYILAHVGSEPGKKPVTKTSHAWGGINSSSILEPIVRLYNITQKTKYIDFAAHIVNQGGIDSESLIDIALENVRMPYQYPIDKAYEIMSFFEGVLEYYRATGIEKYRTAVTNFVDGLIKSEITLIGSAGCRGEAYNNAKFTQFATKNTEKIMQETCVTVTWLKLCHAMLCLTGDSSFADHIENSAFNAWRGAVNHDKVKINEGLPFDSYTPTRAGTRGLATGGSKPLHENGIATGEGFFNGSFYGCCACIGSAGGSLYSRSAVMAAKKGFAINFFMNEMIRTKAPDGSDFVISMQTDYPRSGKVTIIAASDSDAPISLYIRIPRWSAKNHIAIDGKSAVGAKNGKYFKLERSFKEPVTITLELDMRVKLIRSTALPDDPDAALHCAVRRGPLYMSRDARFGDDVHKPVHIIADADGYIDAKETNAPFNTIMTLELPTEAGSLKVCDCSSAGKTWDKTSEMAIWMKTDEYTGN